MADSKTSHWKSLAADLTGKTPADENPVDATADSDDSASGHTTGDIPERTREHRQPVDDTTNEDSNERDQTTNSPVSEGPPPKKKKRGSWAFWRSGNKEKKDTEGNAGSGSSVSDDPLSQLNRAETTDDMACAIDQLFANSGSDTRGDEVVFDADEIATSMDFDEETKTPARDSDTGNSRDDRRERSRGDRSSRSRKNRDDGRGREGRSRDNSGRSRNDREGSRPRDERRPNTREDSRSRSSDRRDRDADSRGSDRDQGRRRSEKPARTPIDHGNVPTWDTAVSFVVDNNMVSREGKSGGKKNTRSRSNKKARN